MAISNCLSSPTSVSQKLIGLGGFQFGGYLQNQVQTRPTTRNQDRCTL